MYSDEEEDRKVARAFDAYHEGQCEQHMQSMDEAEQDQKDLEECKLFHGLVQGRYEAIGELAIEDAVRSMCARRTEPEEFIAVASQHYDVVPLANDPTTDTPLYGVLAKLPAGQMVLFNAFFSLDKDQDPLTQTPSFNYQVMEEVQKLKLTNVDPYLELAFKIDKGDPYPPAVWFAPCL